MNIGPLSQPALRAVLALAIALTCGSAFAQQKLALVVGNSNYESSPLSSPGYDVDAIERTLAKLKFTVVRKKNLDQNSFREELRDFSARLKKSPGAVAFFYYSGHGMQVNGNNYLVPTGTKIESEADVSIYGVRVDEVILRMRSGDTSTSILVLDACRNNPYEKRFKSPDAGLARSAAPPGTLIAFAAAPGAVAAQASGGALSPYTAALVGSLAEPMPLLLTLQKVANKVHTESGGRQSPHIETSAGFDATVSLNASTTAVIASSPPVPKRDEGVNPGSPDRGNAVGIAPELTTGSKYAMQVIQSPPANRFSLKFLNFTAAPDAWLKAWASPSGKLIAYCTDRCRSIVVKATEDMREIARINTRAPNIDGDQNPSWYALGFSHDDAKLVVSYVAGIDNYRSKPSKAALFNLLRGGEQEWEIEIPLGGLDVYDVESTFAPDNRHVLVGNATMAESATGKIVGRFESGGKGWCGLADGSLASYHARTIKWVDSRPVFGQGQYSYLSCGNKIAIVGTSTRVGDKWKRTAYIANGIDRSSWKKIPGDSWDSGAKISPDLRFSVKSSGEIIIVASGEVVGKMSNALRTSCETGSNWKPYASDVYWQANGEFIVWESSDLCGRGPGFARFAIN